MTTIINLESYLECCQYAHLFGENVAKLIPNPKSLPNAYRDFCKKHLSQAFLPVPTLAIAQPQTLSVRPQPFSQSTDNISFTVDDQRDEQIFIVREANSLKMRSFDVPQYLYANVYRYWSYASQLTALTNSSKSLVIYDLDSFTPAQIIPFGFEEALNARYQIPIIDTRSKSQYDSLKLSQPYEDIYNNICDDLAYKIVSDLGIETGIELENITAIFCYIQKINLFQKIIPQCSGARIPLIIEAADTFYPYNLNLSELEAIVYKNIPITELQSIIAKNSDSYNFALVSNVIQSPRLKQHLRQQFSTRSLLVVDTSQNIFNQIWQEKINQNFPLYGQHLDRISFLMGRDNTTEVKLPEKICYEGQQERIVYASYNKGEELQEQFTIRSESSTKLKDVTLRFKINNEIYKESEKEQAYFIENQYFQETAENEITIKIRFRIRPSIIPKLEILDAQNRILISRLVNYEEPVIESNGTSGFLPQQKIHESRCKKSEKFIQAIENKWDSLSTRLQDKLIDFANIFDQYSQNRQDISRISEVSSDLIKIINEYGKVDENDRGKRGFEFCVDQEITIDQRQSILVIKRNYDRIGVHLSSFFSTTKSLGFNSTHSQNQKNYNIAYKKVLEIIGKGFLFSKDIDLSFLYEPRNINYGSKSSLYKHDTYIYSIHLQNIARMSCTYERICMYTKFFDVIFPFSNQKFYQVNDYIWGYARVLMWYVDFGNTSLTNIYKQHFSSLVNHCLTLDHSIKQDYDYLKDALIALIYLLTFRESEPDFVQRESPLYNQAKLLCSQLKTARPFNSRNIEFPVNFFFEELLDGNVTQENINSWIDGID